MNLKGKEQIVALNTFTIKPESVKICYKIHSKFFMVFDPKNFVPFLLTFHIPHDEQKKKEILLKCTNFYGIYKLYTKSLNYIPKEKKKIKLSRVVKKINDC